MTLNTERQAVFIQRLPANTNGRDFVVGDLHGCRTALAGALSLLDFDVSHDRLFSVGDLVDRGPESSDCLALLREPWFHAVRGNHEELMLAHAGPDHTGGSIEDMELHLRNGGQWLANLVPWSKNLRSLFAKAAALPHVLVVGDGPDRFHVLHAQLPLSAAGTTLTDTDVDAGLATVDPSLLTWARQLMGTGGAALPMQQPGLSTTWCGHVPGPAGRTRLSHVCLDTGLAYDHAIRGTDAELVLAEHQASNYRLHRFTIPAGLGRRDV